MTINGRFLTASNLVSVVRILLTVPILLLLVNGAMVYAVALCAFAAWTDWFDGYLARRTQTVSEWGKLIDPIADKILVGGVLVSLLLLNLLPLWFVLAAVMRDVVIVVGGIVATRFTSTILPSLWSGKIAVSLIALTGMLAMLETESALYVSMYGSCLAMAVSLYDYGRRLAQLTRNV